MDNDIIKAIEEKYRNMGQDPNTYLKGLFHSKLINYWDYVEVDTLLSLQKPRTEFSDEPIFIMYHQVTELLLKLITHEIKQIVDNENIDTAVFANKIDRINRYAGILTESFSVMREGMDYDQYNQFRLTLAPASGFQSAQFRFIELYCTDVHLLVNSRVKPQVNADTDMNYLFDNLYWKDAGLDHKTGKKTLTLSQFEDRYIDSLKATAHKYKGRNIYNRFLKLNASDEKAIALKQALRNFDVTYNIVWPLAHLKTAEYYLNSKGENKAATGGSEWQKYLHPSYQRRIFFPELWTKDEIENWGK
ncbi:MAG: tryptophan 2,3-dioxygenase [Bacteroidetes bacterium]|nr:tryptophan 2,3-dioxygenase [Bacteroidota bacterium]